MKRIVIVSDLHAGHKLGMRKEEGYPWWEYFKAEINDLKPIDILVCNGDAIEGKGPRSGGTELIEADRIKQINIAEEVLREAEAREYLFTYGTPAHTGDEEDFEDVLARNMDGTIMDRISMEVEGAVFDIKHKINSSSTPTGRCTALIKQKVWDLFWEETGERIGADVFVRSHVHYYACASLSTFTALTTPALQRAGSKYGARQMEGVVDFGFVHFDVEGGLWQVKTHIARLESAAVLRF